MAAGFPSVYIFRPAYIYPVRPRKEPNFSYRLMRAIYPVFRALFPNGVIRADDLARAMVEVVVRRNGDPLRTGYDMYIGDDVTDWIDDHSRPNPALPLNDVFTPASLAGRPESANRDLDDGGQNPLSKIVHSTVQVPQCADTCSRIFCGRLGAAATLSSRRSLRTDARDHGQEYERN